MEAFWQLDRVPGYLDLRLSMVVQIVALCTRWYHFAEGDPNIQGLMKRQPYLFRHTNSNGSHLS